MESAEKLEGMVSMRMRGDREAMDEGERDYATKDENMRRTHPQNLGTPIVPPLDATREAPSSAVSGQTAHMPAVLSAAGAARTVLATRRRGVKKARSCMSSAGVVQ